MKRLWSFWLALISFALGASAQSLSIDWFVIAGGGGAGTAGDYSINGSIGEPVTSVALSGGDFSVASGFWALPDTFSPTLANGSVIYSRVNSTTLASTIWIAALDGSSDVMLTNGYRAHLSLDHRYLVFTRDGPYGPAYGSLGDLWVKDLMAGTERPVYTHGFDYIIGADFTRDASQIIFDYSCSDYRINRDGTAFEFLSGGSCYEDAPVVNPVDGRVALHDTFRGILISDSNAQNKTFIPNSDLGLHPHWSADGQWISYVNQLHAQEYAGHNVFKIRPDGTDKTQLTSFTDGTDAFPEGAAWTSDGAALIGAATINSVNGLYQVAADGSGTITRLNITQPGDPIRYVGAVVGSSPAPLRIGVFERFGNHFRFSFVSQSGRSYTFQSRTNIAAGVWVDVPGVITVGNGGALQITLSNALAQPQQFYRVQQLP